MNAAKLEADLLSKFKHENIIKFHGIFSGFNNLQTYLIMERVKDALPLHRFIKKRGLNSLTLKEVGSLTRQLVKVVDYLHNECGVAHRDLKPDNIMISDN